MCCTAGSSFCQIARIYLCKCARSRGLFFVDGLFNRLPVTFTLKFRYEVLLDFMLLQFMMYNASQLHTYTVSFFVFTVPSHFLLHVYIHLCVQ